jgi:hypothetical protein
MRLRKENKAFSRGLLKIIQTGNDHVLGYARPDTIVLANFSEAIQPVSFRVLEGLIEGDPERIYGRSEFINKKDLTLQPLDFLAIRCQVRSEA